MWFRLLCIVKFGEHVIYFARSLHLGLEASNIVSVSFLSISPLQVPWLSSESQWDDELQGTVHQDAILPCKTVSIQNVHEHWTFLYNKPKYYKMCIYIYYYKCFNFFNCYIFSYIFWRLPGKVICATGKKCVGLCLCWWFVICPLKVILYLNHALVSFFCTARGCWRWHHHHHLQISQKRLCPVTHHNSYRAPDSWSPSLLRTSWTRYETKHTNRSITSIYEKESVLLNVLLFSHLAEVLMSLSSR